MKDEPLDEQMFMLSYAEITQCSEGLARSVYIFISEKSVQHAMPSTLRRAESTAPETLRKRKRKT